MTPQELKNSILQLAIQGKLVPQRAEEGNAEELYKQIQAEKKKLIKEKKIKKEQPLPEITDEETPFDIPETWKWVRVADCISNKSGLSYKKPNLEKKSDDMIRILRGGNIFNLKYEFKVDDIMIASDFVKQDFFLKKNTIITPAVTSIENICKMALIEKDYNNVVVGGFVLMLIPHLSNQILAKYLLYIFSSKYFKDSCKSITNKSGQAFYNLSREKLMKILVPLPPLAEQKRIVAKIEELLPYVEQYEKAYTELQELDKRFPGDLQKSILQLAIQGKLVPQRAEEGSAEELYKQIQAEKKKLIKEKKIKKEKPLPEITDDEKPFDIPETWKWVRLGEVMSVYGGKRIPAGSKLVTEDTGHKYIRVTDMKNGTIKNDDIKYITEEIYKKIKAYFITKNDIYITVAGTIGQVGLVPEEFDNANLTENADKLVIYSLYKNYVYHLMSSPPIQTQIHLCITKVGQPKLAIVRIQNLLIPLPPLAEQKRIVAKLEEILPLCNKLK